MIEVWELEAGGFCLGFKVILLYTGGKKWGIFKVHIHPNRNPNPDSQLIQAAGETTIAWGVDGLLPRPVSKLLAKSSPKIVVLWVETLL